MLCKICEEKQANPRHVATHGISYEQYMQQYEADMYWKRKAVEKINELYVTVRYQFVEYAPEIIQTVKRDKRGYGLTDKDIMNHLEGKKTLAIYSPEQTTKFLSFDIDTTDLEVLEKLIEAIAIYIPRKDIHCSYSGGKGYHVDLFFDGLVKKEVAVKFYQLILLESGLNPQIVECGGATNRALKLPLGFHVKTGHYCYLSNEYGAEIEDGTHGLKTFCSIHPIDQKLIYEAVEINYTQNYFTDEETIQVEELKADVKELPIYQGNVEYKRDSIRELIQNGIHQQGERHKATYKIAVFLKEEGYSKEGIKQFIEQWTREKCHPSLYTSSEKEVKQDIKDVVNAVFRNDYKLKAEPKDIKLSKLDIKEILSVKSKTLSRLYYIMYTHCKAFGDSQGVFYMTYEQLEEAGLQKDNRPKLKAQIDKLVAAGKVEVIRRNKRVKGRVKSLPNKYRINALQEEFSVTAESFSPCGNSADCPLCAACFLLTDKELKQIYKKDSSRLKQSAKRNCKKPL